MSLHVWDELLKFENVSNIHSHPWHLTSFILSGLIRDTRFVENGLGFEARSFNKYVIHPGKEPRVEHVRETVLSGTRVIHYQAGDTYQMSPRMIHLTNFISGTVTRVHKRRAGPDNALVFARGEWVNARPDEPDQEAALTAIRFALNKLKGEPS